ncbi:hypothetical protein GGR54DRAFT_638313 [Hypoxylon sp. NC1633]|nr:hypothetical protein GGR54DRAFT_638313 [Hypoxylon sp. NC1633]
MAQRHYEQDTSHHDFRDAVASWCVAPSRQIPWKPAASLHDTSDYLSTQHQPTQSVADPAAASIHGSKGGRERGIPLPCDSGHVCTSDSIVSAAGCIRTEDGGAKTFATTCLGYLDYLSGACSMAGPQTGCCSASELPYCSIVRYTGGPAAGYGVAVCGNTSVPNNAPLAWTPTTIGTISPAARATVASGMYVTTAQSKGLENQDIIALAVGIPGAIAGILTLYPAGKAGLAMWRKNPGFWKEWRWGRRP